MSQEEFVPQDFSPKIMVNSSNLTNAPQKASVVQSRHHNRIIGSNGNQAGGTFGHLATKYQHSYSGQRAVQTAARGTFIANANAYAPEKNR